MNITKDEVERRLNDGETLRSIAASIGISHQALSERRRRWGCRRLRKKPTYRPRRSDGTFIDRWGYVQVKTSDKPGAMAYTSQHVMVAQAALGRPLLEGEVVHHVDGNKQNNQPDNLFVCSRSDHRKLHRSLESMAMELVRCGAVVFTDGGYRWNENSPMAACLRELGVLTSDWIEPDTLNANSK